MWLYGKVLTKVVSIASPISLADIIDVPLKNHTILARLNLPWQLQIMFIWLTSVLCTLAPSVTSLHPHM